MLLPINKILGLGPGTCSFFHFCCESTHVTVIPRKNQNLWCLLFWNPVHSFFLPLHPVDFNRSDSEVPVWNFGECQVAFLSGTSSRQVWDNETGRRLAGCCHHFTQTVWHKGLIRGGGTGGKNAKYAPVKSSFDPGKLIAPYVSKWPARWFKQHAGLCVSQRRNWKFSWACPAAGDDKRIFNVHTWKCPNVPSRLWWFLLVLGAAAACPMSKFLFRYRIRFFWGHILYMCGWYLSAPSFHDNT